MYTQCPECLTIYEIDEDALQASLGIVHCGHCGERFDALCTLSDTLPEAPQIPLPVQDPAEHAPTLTAAVPPSAFELAARKRREPPAAAAGGTPQVEPDAEPSASSELPRAGTDDWFADMESQLAAATDGAPAAPGTPMPDPGDDLAWDVVTADGTTDTDGSALPSTASHGDAMPPPVAAAPEESPPAEPPNHPIEATGRDVEPDPLDPGTDGPSATPATSEVVSPLLLEDDASATQADAATASGDAAVDETAVAIEADAPSPDGGGDDAPPEPGPVYIPPRRRLVSASGLAWSAGCLVLALVLAGQLAWANRADLIRDPATRPLAGAVCRNIPCQLPPIKDTAQLELLSRDVRPDPDTAGALAVTATLRNNASFRQPWPIVVVELTDFDNHAVAMRRFRPAEYMPDPARRADGIAPGATAALAFEVVDPGKRAGGFRFSFE